MFALQHELSCGWNWIMMQDILAPKSHCMYHLLIQFLFECFQLKSTNFNTIKLLYLFYFWYILLFSFWLLCINDCTSHQSSYNSSFLTVKFWYIWIFIYSYWLIFLQLDNVPRYNCSKKLSCIFDSFLVFVEIIPVQEQEG